MGKAVFSFSELLVLLDVDGVPATRAPFPTMDELAPSIGPLRFRMNPPLLPPRANLAASPIAAELSIRQFQIGGADAVWEHMYGWITSYLDDTLTKVPKSAGPTGFRTYKGHGVMVLLAYNKPNGYAEPCFELKVLRDEHPMQTVATLFGVTCATLAAALDANWHTLPSSREMHVEASCVDDVVRLRCNALRQTSRSDASTCSSWTTFWLQWWLPPAGAMSISKVPNRTLAEHEHATEYPFGKDRLVTVNGTSPRRDQFELHVPRRWLVELASARQT